MQQGIEAAENFNQLKKPEIKTMQEAIEKIYKLREKIR